MCPIVEEDPLTFVPPPPPKESKASSFFLRSFGCPSWEREREREWEEVKKSGSMATPNNTVCFLLFFAAVLLFLRISFLVSSFLWHLRFLLFCAFHSLFIFSYFLSLSLSLFLSILLFRTFSSRVINRCMSGYTTMSRTVTARQVSIRRRITCRWITTKLVFIFWLHTFNLRDVPKFRNKRRKPIFLKNIHANKFTLSFFF